MRRTPLKPGRGFKSRAPSGYGRDPDRIRQTPAPNPREFRAPRPIEGHAEPVEKEGALQHGKYMALVRMFPCARCGRAAPSQFCHRDMGKGQGLKTDCREGFPGCVECHVLLGSSGKIPREERRELERKYGRQTRDKMRAMNLWPHTLPPWKEDDDLPL